MANKMKTRVPLIVFCVVAVVVGWFYTSGKNRKEKKPVAQPGTEVSTVQKKGGKTPGKSEIADKNGKVRKEEKKTDPQTVEEERVDAVVQPLNDAVNADDAKKILLLAETLRKDPNPEVRKQVAFALDWIGLQGMEMLTKMLGDPDPDVQREVLENWVGALSGISDQTAKGNLICEAVKTQSEGLSLESFEELISTARFELESPHDAETILSLIQSTQEKETERMKILLENMNDLTGEDATSRAQAVESGTKYIEEQKAEVAEEAATAEGESGESQGVPIPGKVTVGK